MMLRIIKNTLFATKVLTAIEASPLWRETFPTGREVWPLIQGLGMEAAWRELIGNRRTAGATPGKVADIAIDEILGRFMADTGLTTASKKKHVLPEAAYQSDDPFTAFRSLHIFAAHGILDTWDDDRMGEGGDENAYTVFAITSHIGSTIEAARKCFPDRTPPIEDDSLFSRLVAVGSGKGNGAEFPPVSPLVASLQKYHAESDVSLFPLIMGTYAPGAVCKMFADMMANPPKDATPDHLREAVELCAAASRGY
jgi:hypothetical protein